MDAADFTPSANAVPPVPLPLRLQPTWCVNCGYSLAGLPSDSAVCPECGARIDPSLIVLYGWARGFQANAANTRGRPLVWVFLLIALQIVCYAPQFFVGGFDRIVALGVVAIWLLPALHLLSRRNRGNHPGGVQVRLSDAGCVQYNDLAGPSIVRDLLQSWGWLVLGGAFAVLLAGYCFHEVPTVAFFTWGPATLILAVALFRPELRYRRALAEQSPSAMADACRLLAKPAPWSKVYGVVLRPSGQNQHRLKLQVRGTWRHDPGVNADINCTDEQAEHLRQQTDQWRSAAQAKPMTSP